MQQEVLQDLVGMAKKTRWGIKHDFRSLNTYAAFSRRVPIVQYEDIAEEINISRLGEENLFWPTPIKWYAKSSGTTNAKSKYIPLSVEALEDCHYKAGKDMLSLYINNNPEAQLFNGKTLRLGAVRRCFKMRKVHLEIFPPLSPIIYPYGRNSTVLPA